MQLIEIIKELEATDKNIPSLEIDSYRKHFSKSVFYAKNYNK